DASQTGQNLALPGIFQGTSAQDSWNQIANQIQAEGQAAGSSAQSIANNLATAQEQYLSKLQSFIDSGITQVQPNLATLAQAAQTATLATNTVYGAVNAIQGIKAGIAAGNPQVVEAGVQALVGVITTAAISVGAVSAGVGAAIGAAIELTVEILDAAGIIPSVPPGSIYVGDGHCSNQGFTAPGQATVGGTIPVANLSDGLVTPGAHGEGVCVWGSLISPGSDNWRSFPDPGNASDAQLWYTVVTEATWYWPPGAPSQAKWYTKNDGNWRPIDNAFHRYRQLECDESFNYMLTSGGGPGVSTETLTGDAATAVPAFMAAYFHMWKKNAEFALNGISPAPDTLVLEQLVATWNAAHAPGVGFTFMPAPSDLQGQGQGNDCSAVTAGYSYISMLVADLVNASSASLTNGGLHINTGAQLTPPNTGFVTAKPIILSPTAGGIGPAATTTTSTGNKVAVGVLAAGAVGAGSIYAYAIYNGITFTEALKRLRFWK
ncbi:MAG TPA: hypothetical protein VMI75_04465, partial [Polyangiaceae bacterium]|nr:hypothetical protein [Polyangiaceae bacterium]